MSMDPAAVVGTKWRRSDVQGISLVTDAWIAGGYNYVRLGGEVRLYEDLLAQHTQIETVPAGKATVSSPIKK